MDDNCKKRKKFKSDPSKMDNPNAFQVMVTEDPRELRPVYVGKAKYAPGQQEVARCPANIVTLFYSCEGGGSFKLKDTWYHVREHEFFVLPVNTATLLYADTRTGWIHRWIGFSGALIHDFMNFPTVFSLPEEITATLYDPTEKERNLFSRLAGDLYHIHAIMNQEKEKMPDYVQRVVNRINTSYMEKLTVTDMANELSLDRSHLSRLFKDRMGTTIQDYIVNLRITKAKQLLLSGRSVSDAAQLCGFVDYTSFSRVFLRETGVRPTAWLKYLKKSASNKPR